MCLWFFTLLCHLLINVFWFAQWNNVRGNLRQVHLLQLLQQTSFIELFWTCLPILMSQYGVLSISLFYIYIPRLRQFLPLLTDKSILDIKPSSLSQMTSKGSIIFCTCILAFVYIHSIFLCKNFDPTSKDNKNIRHCWWKDLFPSQGKSD
jgi:hypothetical protein